MIPKIIHYCWFGGNPLPELAQKCIASWKKYCPDYEIREWNETNFDVTKNSYMYEAYQAKKWGFVPDYARLEVIYKYGGVYLDTDVELLRPLDRLMENGGFIGFEDGKHINFGSGFGAAQYHPMLKKVLEDYSDRHFLRQDGSFDLTPSPVLNTAVFLEHGLLQNNTLQTVNGLTVYPTDYFCPMDAMTKELNLSENTYSIHHYDGSWQSEELKQYRRYYSKMYPELKKFLPASAANLIAKFIARARSFGVLQATKKARAYIKKRKLEG